jgi:hypothetical protein
MTVRVLRTLALGIVLQGIVAFSAHGQSLLSLRYPLGLPLEPMSGSAMSMGGVNTALAEDFQVMLGNPANLGIFDNVAFSSLFTLDGLRIRDESGHSNHIDFVPRQVSFALPVNPVGNLGFALSLRSDANIAPFESDEIAIGEGFVGKTLLDVDGSVVSWQLGLGRSISDLVYLGLAYERVYFSREVTLLTQLAEPSEQSRDSTRQVFRGNGIRAGAMVPIGPVTAGLAVEHVFAGDLEQSEGIFRGTRDEQIPATRNDTEVTLEYPTSLSAGAAWAITPSWLAGGDIDLTLWKNFDSEGVLNEPDINTVSLQLGGRFIPAPNLLNPEYWETIHYRAGLRLRTLPEDGSSEQAASIGAGFPLRGGGLADLVLFGGRRIHDRYSGYREYFISFGFGINGGRTGSRSSAVTNY